MIDIPKLSQNHPAWKNMIHGTSDRTWGQTGCTATCVVAIANWLGNNITVPEFNIAMNKIGGWSNGNLIIWSKINQIIPEMKFKFRYSIYDNNLVKSEVENGRPVIVKVKFDSNGSEHWVVYVGDRMLMDPYDGKIKATSVYEPAGPFVTFDYLTKEEAKTPPPTPAIGGTNMSDAPVANEPIWYEGLNLRDEASMREAVKTWAEVRDGKFMRKSDVEANYITREKAESLVDNAVDDAEQKGNNAIKNFELSIKERLGLRVDDPRESIYKQLDDLMANEDVANDTEDLERQVQRLSVELEKARNATGIKSGVNLSEFLSKPFLTWLALFILAVIGLIMGQINYNEAIAAVTVTSGVYGLAASTVKKKEIERDIAHVQTANQ